jgi:tetratricopeptide (TPR) repeat protein
LGSIWLVQGRFDQASELLHRVVAEAPDQTEALNDLAWLLALREPSQAKEALGLINRALDVTGAFPPFMDTRAVVLIRAGQLDEAILELDRARHVDPKNPSLALHQAWAYRDKGNTEKARKAFRLAKDMGWTVTKSDPLERPFIAQLERDLTGGP